MRANRSLSLLLLVALLSSCAGRRVNLAPEEVQRLDDAKWTIEHEPGAEPSED